MVEKRNIFINAEKVYKTTPNTKKGNYKCNDL